MNPRMITAFTVDTGPSLQIRPSVDTTGELLGRRSFLEASAKHISLRVGDGRFRS
jgi:hypothetical protein